MILILEGPDGAGKTYLARQLIQRFNLEYRHEGPPPVTARDGPDALLRHYGLQLDAARGQNVVFDRLFLGETIYGPILRGASGLSLAALRELRRLANAVGTVEVLCLPGRTSAFECWSWNPDELLTTKVMFNEAYEGWERLSDTYGFDLTYDWENDSLDALTTALGHAAERTTLPAGWTGSPRASFVFVGDRASDPTNPVNVPFFGTTGCGPYLRATLDRAGFDDEETSFVNAYSLRGNMALLSLKHLEGSVVVALGRNAHRALNTQKIAHHELPHPQYRKRFFYDQQDEYVAMLRGLRSLL